MLFLSAGRLNIFANEISENKSDIYSQNLIENVSIEGDVYRFKHHYNENGDRTIFITNKTRSKTEILTLDSKTSNVLLNNNEIGNINTSNRDKQELSNSKAVDTRWRRIVGPVHQYISWKKGTATAVVLGSISIYLGLKTSYIKTTIGTGALGILAASCSGGTLHYTGYYRNLAFGQVQYKTNWSFVASTGDRYGTYTYLSLPQ